VSSGNLQPSDFKCQWGMPDMTPASLTAAVAHLTGKIIKNY